MNAELRAADDGRRTAVVTGSAGTLGRALAVRLARRGYQLALVDLDDARNRETLSLVEAAGGSGRLEPLDVASPDDWRALHDRLRAAWPRLDMLVNCAGIAGAGHVGEFPPEDWRRLLDVDLMSVVYACHTLVPWLKEGGRSAYLVNVASFAGFGCLPEMAAYNVAKAGVIALSETLRAELAPAGVGVSVVCPWFFRSGLLERAKMCSDDQKEFARKAMDNARGTADEVADDVMRAVDKRRFYVVQAGLALRYWRLKRLLPEWFLGKVSQQYLQGEIKKRFQKRETPPNA
jgi:NAD(P)-dependent dehydrogenase (short-subunit alcohol dehydrogenase family)